MISGERRRDREAPNGGGADVKIQDYGKAALLTVAGSWGTGILFTLAAWASLAIANAGARPGPTPTPAAALVFSVLAGLSFPIGLVGLGFGVAALFKRQSVGMAIAAGCLGLPYLLFLAFGFWVAAHGGV